MICYFTKILVCPLIFPAVRNFNVYKLIGNPAKIYKGICVSEPSALGLIPRPQFHLPAPVVSVFLPSLALNLCFPVLCFLIKLCCSYSIFFTYFLSIMWEINKLFESFHKRYFRFSQLASSDRVLFICVL